MIFRTKWVGVLVAVALMALVGRAFVGTSARQAHRFARDVQYSMHCGACGRSYTNSWEELNQLIEGGRIIDLPSGESVSRKFECPLCGKMEGVLLEYE